MLSEIDKDVDRLQMIAERFSKIGSVSDWAELTCGKHFETR